MSVGFGSSEEERKKYIKDQVRYLSLNKKVSFYKLSIKYWMGGDDWLFAQEYAISLIKGFR